MGNRRFGCLRLQICTSRVRIPNLWINTKKIKVLCSNQHYHCTCKDIKESRWKRRKDKKEVGKRLVKSRKRFKHRESKPVYGKGRKSRKDRPKKAFLDPITNNSPHEEAYTPSQMESYPIPEQAYSPSQLESYPKPVDAYSPNQVESYPKPAGEHQPPVQIDSNVERNEEPVSDNSNEGKTFCQILIDLPPRYRLTTIYTKGTVIQVDELIYVDEASGVVKFLTDRTRISSLSCTEIDGIVLGPPASKPKQDDSGCKELKPEGSS